MLKESVFIIGLVIGIVVVASLFYIQINEQNPSIFNRMLSLFFGSSSNFNNNQDLSSNSEAFKVGQLGRPIGNGPTDLSLTELFAKSRKICCPNNQQQ